MTADTSSRDAIMEATFDALCEHGYASLTMQSIADQFDKSKSLIHYHFDSKDELLTAFMAYLLEGFVGQIEACGTDDPTGSLLGMAYHVVVGDDDSRDFHTALLELRAQAPYNAALRHQLVENDRRIRKLIADIVREGQDAGEFDESVDPEAFAVLFRSTIEGAQSHEVILGDDAPSDEALAAVETLLVERLLIGAEDGT